MQVLTIGELTDYLSSFDRNTQINLVYFDGENLISHLGIAVDIELDLDKGSWIKLTNMTETFERSTEVHEGKKGDGGYQGFSYVAIPFIVRTDTPEKAKELVDEFVHDVDAVIEQYPELDGCDELSDCIACFSEAIEIAENTH